MKISIYAIEDTLPHDPIKGVEKRIKDILKESLITTKKEADKIQCVVWLEYGKLEEFEVDIRITKKQIKD